MATQHLSASACDAPLVELRGASRHYGPVAALSDVDFVCKAGEIHAVLGENGAGKSTLMKLIAGVVQPSPGKLLVNGNEVTLASPAVALRHGIVCMFQELSLAPDLSVRDNILLGAPSTGLGFFSYKRLAEIRSLLDRIAGEHISLSTRVRDLTLPDRQLVEIVKALYRKPRLLILDEATSALNANVVERIFSLLRELRDKGLGVLLISHRFHEIEALADRISVFRNGRFVESFPNGHYQYADIIKLMVGQTIDELFPAKPAGSQMGDCVLKVENLNWNQQLHNVSFTVNAGQITGIGGLDGQGQMTLMHALFGVLKQVDGNISINNTLAHLNSPRSAKAAKTGLALVPEDRKTEGLIPDLSIEANLELAILGHENRNNANFETLAEELELSCASFSQAVSALSGGNQQKVALMKWLALHPRCLLLADPTRGIDVKTKTQIYALLRRLAKNGVAVVLLSTDHEELVHLCDEVHVFYAGQITQTLQGGALSPENVVSASLDVQGVA